MLALAALTACSDKTPQNGDSGQVEHPTLQDEDGDGYSATVDCDDTDAMVNPGMDESCNGVDDDCDGSTDEDGAPGGAIYYPDTDGDGAGASESGVRTCSPPTGWVTEGTDCDDSNATVSPAADEVCDGIDNNCDGAADEAGVTDGLPSYADADGDGYGDPDARSIVCDYPAGSVANGDDCDDTSADIKPGAAEVCDDADNDCDGETDEDATDTSTWYLDSDNDSYGVDTTTTAACDRPTGYASTADDCDDSDARVNPGAAERCDDADNDCDGETDEDALGAPTYYPDADLDGYGTDDGSVTQCDEPDGDYATTGGDCDDDDDTVNPAAEEIWYDGLDEDCDEASDYDQDADGYVTSDLEDPDEPTYDPGTGEIVDSGDSTEAGDCDDTNARTYPGQRERCDGVDNNCDGNIDEDAVDGDSYYLDGDGDGFGDEDSEVETCDDIPEGYIDVGGDCDDTDSAINPDATEDTTDGIDNDCDGRTDETTGAATGSGYFVAGVYSGGWDCLEYFDAEATELSSSCDACDFGWQVEASWVDGAAESLGYTSCGLDSFSFFSGDEEFSTSWGFAYTPTDYPYPLAYYSYGDTWYPTSYLYYSTSTTGGYMQWIWFYDSGYTGEVELFFLYTY